MKFAYRNVILHRPNTGTDIQFPLMVKGTSTEHILQQLEAHHTALFEKAYRGWIISMMPITQAEFQEQFAADFEFLDSLELA